MLMLEKAGKGIPVRRNSMCKAHLNLDAAFGKSYTGLKHAMAGGQGREVR